MKEEAPITGKEFHELKKTMTTVSEVVQSKIEEGFDNLVEKLGCDEDEVLMEELHELFSKELQPLRESFQQVYSKVFTPQIEKIDVSCYSVLIEYDIVCLA